MTSELNEKRLPRFCCLYGHEIDCDICNEIGSVAEGLFPQSELPLDMGLKEMGEERTEKCLACEYHIE